MDALTQSRGITFAVDDVAPATEALPVCRAYEAIRQLLGGSIESCSDYHSTVVASVGYQPLLAAVYTAYCLHRPLVLTPDAVWLTIAQGIAHHMTYHAEELRSRFVAHQGRLELQFRCYDWVEGSPENPWAEAFEGWTQQIRDHVGDAVYESLVCNFSTTGAVERAASQVVMMDVFERYFRYELYLVCGIPTITLEGTAADWQSLADKARIVDNFGMDWWSPHLMPICEQFVRASRKDIDLGHWQNICKLKSEYGGDIINGWIAKMFPYLTVAHHGACSRRNPIFETGAGFKTWNAPSGLSRVLFGWNNMMTGRRRKMEMIGGLVGVSQDETTLALRPKAGWAVRESDKIDALLEQVVAEHKVCDGARRSTESRAKGALAPLPQDLEQFHHRTNGAQLFISGSTAEYSILPWQACEALDWTQADESENELLSFCWRRFAELANGEWLAINLLPKRDLPRKRVSVADAVQSHLPSSEQRLNPVCVCSPGTIGTPGQNPVVALSFTEFLERALCSNTHPFWGEPGFTAYGDAEQYTRRKPRPHP